jgi:hypothetical protein
VTRWSEHVVETIEIIGLKRIEKFKNSIAQPKLIARSLDFSVRSGYLDLESVKAEFM